MEKRLRSFAKIINTVRRLFYQNIVGYLKGFNYRWKGASESKCPFRGALKEIVLLILISARENMLNLN